MSDTFGKLFGSKQKQITQPTGFETLPGFARSATEQAVTTGQELAQQPGLFAPADLTPEQRASLETLTAGLQPTTPEAFQTGLTTFGDPFQEQVIQNVIRDIQEAGAGQLSDIGSFASAAGGFGGTRQALLESELQTGVRRDIGDVSSRLRSQGFQSAAERTLADLSRTQDVAGNLFGFAETGRQIQTQQKQAPLQAVQFLQNLARGVPTGGGAIGFAPTQPGLLERFGRGGEAFQQGVSGFAGGAGQIAGIAGGF